MIKTGSRVKYVHIGTEDEISSGFYPPIGTMGTVKEIYNNLCLIKWDEGTIEDGVWYCETTDIEEIPSMIYEVLINFDPITYGQDIVTLGVFDTSEKANKAKELAEELLREAALLNPEEWEGDNTKIYIVPHKLNHFELWGNKQEII